MFPAVPLAVKLLLLLKVFQSVDEREPVADVPARAMVKACPEMVKPLVLLTKVTSPVLVPDVVALPAKASVYPPPIIVALLMVEVEMDELMIELVPVRVVLPPWRDRVLELRVKVPVPVVKVLPFRVVAVAVPKEEVAVAVMEVNDGLADKVIWVEVPIKTFCPPVMLRLEPPAVKEARVLVPVPPLATDSPVPDQLELLMEFKVAKEPSPRLVLAVEVLDRSDRLLAVCRKAEAL